MIHTPLPPSCWSAGFFPYVSVRWSNRWLFILEDNRSWSPKPAFPFGVSSSRQQLYRGKAMLSLAPEIFAMVFCRFLCVTWILRLHLIRRCSYPFEWWKEAPDVATVSSESSQRLDFEPPLQGPLRTPLITRCLFNLYQSDPLAWHSSTGRVCFNCV